MIEGHPTNTPVLALFWLYVLIPLAWGVYKTLVQAATMFH
jgi:hypothetical protein